VTDQSLVAAEPAIMRRINAARALREVHRLGRLTVTQLVERTGLSRRTAEAVLDGLVQAGLVADEPPVHRGDRVGRPARTFRFRTDAALAMGVDVDTRSIRAMLSDLSGSILGMGEVGVTPSSSRAVRLAAIHEAARQALDESGQPADGLQAVTIGTPGVVLPDGSVTVCKVLQNWSNFPLGRALSDGFPCPVIVENDTNLSAVGERWRGTSADVDDVVWVQAGRRVRIAILVGGRLYRGADGAAGEVGWLSQLAWDAVRDHPLSASGSGRSQVDANYVRLVTAATADPQASGLFDEYGRALSLGLAAVVLTLNPRYLVIGGAAAALAGEVLTASIRRHLGPMCLVLPEVRASSLGAEAVVTGAIRMSLDAIEESLFSIRLPRGVPAQAD
jgi:predicted NBD/HSP70 family sugar kinase